MDELIATFPEDYPNARDVIGVPDTGDHDEPRWSNYGGWIN